MLHAKICALLYFKVRPVHVSALGAISYAHTCIGSICTDGKAMSIIDRFSRFAMCNRETLVLTDISLVIHGCCKAENSEDDCE